MKLKSIMILVFGLFLLNCANVQPELKAMTATIQKIQDASCGNCNGKIKVTFITNNCNDLLSYPNYAVTIGNTMIEHGPRPDTVIVWIENLCPGIYHIGALTSYQIINGEDAWSPFTESNVTITGSTNPPEITGDYGPELLDCYKSGWGHYSIDTNNVEMEPGGSIIWTKDGQLFPEGNGKTSIDDLEAGTYKMVVTDKNGCKDTVEFTIPEQFREVPIVYEVYNAGCSGDSTSGEIYIGLADSTIETGDIIPSLRDSRGISIPLQSYSGTKNGFTWEAKHLSPGTYRLAVFDTETDCIKYYYITVLGVTQLSATLTSKNPGCNGSPNSGSITVNITSGTPPYIYTWTPNVSTTNTASGLLPGVYSVMITDSNGCSIMLQATLIQVPQLSFTLTVFQWKSVNDSCISKAWVTNLTGTPPFTYEWSDGSTSSSSYEHIPGGGIMYTCTVTDANGCQTTHSVTAEDCTEEDNFTSSPNPSNDFVNLFYLPINLNPYLKFIVYDQSSNIKDIIDLGQVFTSPVTTTLNTSSYLPGVYFIVAYENNVPMPLSVRFIKQSN